MTEGSSVSITGMGIICAIGTDCNEVLSSLRSRRSGIEPVRYLETVHKDIPVGEVKMSNADMKRLLHLCPADEMSRTSLMGAIAIREALSKAGFSDAEALSGRRVTLISGTTVGNMDITEKYYERMKTDDSLLSLPSSNECGESTLEMARIAGLENVRACTVSTACSSALNSIIVGCEMLRRGETDLVIAGGSESLSRFHLNGFNSLMILDRERCRPFDETRAGLNLGEGAAFVVLERNALHPLAFIRGYGNRCDAFHQTASSPEGEGAFLAMTDALAMAGLCPADIQYVNAHGTGTPNNDLSESKALLRVFGDRIPEVSSTKAFTGHTTSASGSIETVICVLAMQNSFTPANIGWKTPIPEGIIPTEGRNGVQLTDVMCNSFGFGGNDSSIVLSTGGDGGVACAPLEKSAEFVQYESVVRSTEELPLLREFISPVESRRMTPLVKAAFLSALRALKDAGIECPDAIISATSRGMLEVSQNFLDEINANGEQQLKPTLFMMSTHNTVGSSLAVHLKCHGYNITYSQGDDSLSWAVADARRLLDDGRARSVLVVSFDECTPAFASLCGRAGRNITAGIYAKSVIFVNKN